MLLADITPVIITFNEEPNIRRCLEGLGWAEQILVVDSGSSDATLEICREFPHVRVLHRPFDSFARQCNYALSHVTTEWTLSFDADYIAGSEFAAVLRHAPADSGVAGYRCAFRYCINGRRLRGTLYPPRVVLYRTALAQYEDDGHGHRVKINGAVENLPAPLDHDDRKPLARWFRNQHTYAALEAGKLLSTPRARLDRIDRIRRAGWLAPLLVLPYCLILKRGILDGRQGWLYALQRLLAETILAMELLERRIGNSRKGKAESSLSP
jgi:glycosyltransferase involved in cell wall biosynthesis